MGFKKAKPEQSKLRLALYGPPGSGKTFSSLLIAEGLAIHEKKRIAYIDTEESGTDFYAMDVPSRPSHPKAFDFDVLRTQSLADTWTAIQALDPKEHGVIVVDSISHLWESAMAAGDRTKKDTVKFGDWAKVKRPYKNLVKWLMESDFHVLICGRQKNVFDDSDGDVKKVGVTMNAERDTAYEPQVCIRLEPRVNPKDTTRTIYHAFVEKDRTGVLAGRTIANISFETFAPVVGLLTGSVPQNRLADPDEAAAKDAELMEREEQAVAERKNAKSRELLAIYSKRLQDAEAAKDAAALRVIGEELNTKRGQIEDNHYEVLGECWVKAAKAVRGDK